MLPAIVLMVGTFVIGLALMPLLREWAKRSNLVDSPDGRRKIHKSPIPLSGGLALYLSILLTMLVCLSWPGEFFAPLTDSPQRLVGIFLGMTVIAGVGWLDDSRGLRGRHKLFGQIIAVSLVIFIGELRIERLTLIGQPVELGLMSIPFTYFWFLGAINALNLIDGMDGLLGTIAGIATLTIMVTGIITGQLFVACLAGCLAGGLAAFLCFNRPPATIYMGDCGSMLTGLLVAGFAIAGELKRPAALSLALPVSLLILPIFDTLTAILRRKLTGRSVYTTDRGHLHHCLLRSGMSVPRVLLLVIGFCLLGAGGAILSVIFENDLFALAVAIFTVGSLIGAKLFGHAELDLLWQKILGRRQPDESRIMQVRLQGSIDWNEIWQMILAEGRQLRLDMVALDVNAPFMHEGYHARWERPVDEGTAGTPPDAWRAELPLCIDGQAVARIAVHGRRNDQPLWQRLSELARLTELAEARIQLLIANKAISKTPTPGLPVPS